MKKYKIAVAGTGYVGLSLSVLLAQHNQVMTSRMSRQIKSWSSQVAPAIRIPLSLIFRKHPAKLRQDIMRQHSVLPAKRSSTVSCGTM